MEMTFDDHIKLGEALVKPFTIGLLNIATRMTDDELFRLRLKLNQMMEAQKKYIDEDIGNPAEISEYQMKFLNYVVAMKKKYS